MTHLTASDIMARSEITLSPDMDIFEALHQLLDRKLTGAPVVGGDGALLGMLTERDCLKVVVAGELHGWPGGKVSDYMSGSAESISPSTSLYDIVHLFLTRTHRKLPVVDERGQVVGQVSRRDALTAFESARDNPRLFGSNEEPVPDGSGVDSAMRIARTRK